MKLIRFKGNEVHGYIKFNIPFNKDLTFLVGSNGSGKTTALMLLQSLLAPSFEDLYSISFGKIELEYAINNKEFSIKCEKNKNEMILSFSEESDKLVLPNYQSEEIEYLSTRNRFQDMIKELGLKNKNHPVIKAISSIKSPVFLGLERRNDFQHHFEDDSLFYERDIFIKNNTLNHFKTKRLLSGSLNGGLEDAEYIIQEAYKRIRKIESSLSVKLRDNILLSAFRYKKFDITEFNKNWSEKRSVLKKRKEIKDAISKIDEFDNKLTRELDNFFDNIEKLFDDKKDDDKVSVEWLLNNVQIDRIFDVIEIVENHKEKIDKFFLPINQFLDTVNEFFKDSNKQISINTVGKLEVIRPNKSSCGIGALSSGERQILVIFAHVFFNKYSTQTTQRGRIFILDEPELSLHLRWQQIFVETIMEKSVETQFIMATHSPDIIDEYKSKAFQIRRV